MKELYFYFIFFSDNARKKYCSTRSVFILKMAATVEEHNRPLKRQKLGIPDVYPQSTEQREVIIFFLNSIFHLLVRILQSLVTFIINFQFRRKKSSWEQNAYFCSSLIYYAILTQWYNRYNFFSDNATIIYWIKEINSCFLRIASKTPVRIQQNLYTVFEWMTKQPTEFNFFLTSASWESGG